MIRFAAKLRGGVAYLKDHGVQRFGREVRHRLIDDYHERRLGISTSAAFDGKGTLARSDWFGYAPISYAAFYSVLNRLPVNKKLSGFLDYGIGKGRAICAAATYPFKTIVGVEVSDELLALAAANLCRMKHRRAERVDLTHADATTFEIPNDINVIHFYNPFRGETLRKVVEQVRDSSRRHPRKIFVIYFNNDLFDEVVHDQAWIKKIEQTEYYPVTSCGLYETVGGASTAQRPFWGGS